MITWKDNIVEYAPGIGVLTDVYGVPLFSSASFDAFGRLRVSNPEYVFDAQPTYDLHPLLFEQITAETGAAIAHDATNRCATLTFASTPTGGRAIMQTFEHFRYQPGRSHLALLTSNFEGGATNVTKFAGLSDGTNGVELQLVGSAPQVLLRSGTGAGDRVVPQALWKDKLDGTGHSKVTVDRTKTQILVIDLQALYVGRVRLALNIDGALTPFCDINNANRQANPYIQTANLPVRVGMTCTGTVSTTMKFICSSVISEGGQLDPVGYQFAQEGTVTAANGSRTHVLSLRPKTTFNSIANRSKFVLETVEVFVTGSNPIKWELCLGDIITGTTTFSDVDATYSAMEYNVAGATSGSPAIVLANGYVAAGSSVKIAVSRELRLRYPITLNAAGAARSLGTLTLLATAYTGTSAVRGSLNWREVR